MDKNGHNIRWTDTWREGSVQPVLQVDQLDE